MELKRSLVCLCLAALVPVGVGCTRMNTYENAQTQGKRQEVQDRRVITDFTLHSKACVVGLNAVTQPNGILRLQAEVLNLTWRSQRFFYTIEWLDLNGMQVSTAGGGWTERQIMSKEVVTIQATAPSPACKDFRIKLIEHPRHIGRLVPAMR